MVSVQVDIDPEQAPTQLLKVEPESADAVSVTLPEVICEQVAPPALVQLIPAGVLDTVPLPATVTVRV